MENTDNKSLLKFEIGIMPRGKLNSIADVDGVAVGHVTLSEGTARTGVTAIIPHRGNIFREKVMAGCHVINGFGKSAGLVQVEELGTIETPIILTNTLSVGDASKGLIQYMLKENADIGRTTGTVNPLVCECNDGFLNDIRAFHVKPEHVEQAIAAAGTDFAQGDVGAGKGMSCYELKGGIGSSSRTASTDGCSFTVGALVLSNFGEIGDLTVAGLPAGRRIAPLISGGNDSNPGSIIAVIATDAPLSERQLKRICRRASVGIGKTGSYIRNGSGEIAVAFTTANIINHYSSETVIPIRIFNDDRIDVLFRAAAEATEEAVINSMLRASPVTGRNGNHRRSLAEFADTIRTLKTSGPEGRPGI